MREYMLNVSNYGFDNLNRERFGVRHQVKHLGIHLAFTLKKRVTELWRFFITIL